MANAHTHNEINAARLTNACAYALVLMQVSRDLFGKPLFSLGVGERQTADAQAWQMVQGLVHNMTPEWLAGVINPQPGGPQNPVGFQPPPASTATAESTQAEKKS